MDVIKGNFRLLPQKREAALRMVEGWSTVQVGFTLRKIL